MPTDERAKVNSFVKELIGMHAPLTLPFVNRELYETMPGFYKNGSEVLSLHIPGSPALWAGGNGIRSGGL